MKEKLQNLLKRVPAEMLAIAVAFLLSLLVFSLIVHEAVYEREDLFDQAVIRFFAAHSSAGFIAAMKIITFFGSSTFLLPAYIVLIARYIAAKNNQTSIEIAVIGISSTALMFGLKQFFQRQRPQLPILQGISGYSFPSGHALSSFIFCSILIYLLRKEKLAAVTKNLLTALLLLCAVLIGLSRIVLNVHYATDVIGGFCLGFAWVILAFAILRKFRKNDTVSSGSAV
jgi:membrane-associated phospholipid phosphatase